MTVTKNTTDSLDLIEEERMMKIASTLSVLFMFVTFMHFFIIVLLFSWADYIATFFFTFLFIAPASVTNGIMVLVGGGKPIDGGRNFRDGRRLFGDHKTWNGFIKGPILTTAIAMALLFIFLLLWFLIKTIPMWGIDMNLYVYYNDISYFEYYFIGGSFTMGIWVTLIRVSLCAFGGVFGDLVGSFLKRRINIKSGEPFWIGDQFDYVVFAILFSMIPMFLFPTVFLFDMVVMLSALVMAPSMSVIGNVLGYKKGLKDVPW